MSELAPHFFSSEKTPEMQRAQERFIHEKTEHAQLAEATKETKAHAAQLKDEVEMVYSQLEKTNYNEEASEEIQRLRIRGIDLQNEWKDEVMRGKMLEDKLQQSHLRLAVAEIGLSGDPTTLLTSQLEEQTKARQAAIDTEWLAIREAMRTRPQEQPSILEDNIAREIERRKQENKEKGNPFDENKHLAPSVVAQRDYIKKIAEMMSPKNSAVPALDEEIRRTKLLINVADEMEIE